MISNKELLNLKMWQRPTWMALFAKVSQSIEYTDLEWCPFSKLLITLGLGTAYHHVIRVQLTKPARRKSYELSKTLP